MANPDEAMLPTAALKDALASGDGDAVCAALHDILLFKSVTPLTPADLDAIAGALEPGERAARTALQILHAAAVRQGTLPGNTLAAAGRIRAILERSREDPDGRPAIRDAVHLLAAMGDPLAIEQLVYDAPHFDGERVKIEDYLHPVMVGALRRHDAELAALQADLGESRAAEDLEAIREYARDPAAYEERVRLAQDEEVEIF